MSGKQITSGYRAIAAMSAAGTYARMPPPSEPLPEGLLSPGSEREPEERSGDRDRLSGLLSRLMYYAGRRGPSFAAALTAAGRSYGRQRTTCPSGDAVQRTGQTRRGTRDAPVTGEIVKARPGAPAVYEADFITAPERGAQPGLSPAPPFPAADRHGEIPSASVTRDLLVRAVRRIETACRNGSDPDPGGIQNPDSCLTALSGWSALDRVTVPGTFTMVLTGQDGHLLIPAPGTHSVSLAPADMPHPPEPGTRASNEPGASAAASPSRTAVRRSRKGGQ